jgi:Phage integrase family
MGFALSSDDILAAFRGSFLRLPLRSHRQAVADSLSAAQRAMLTSISMASSSAIYGEKTGNELQLLLPFSGGRVCASGTLYSLGGRRSPMDTSRCGRTRMGSRCVCRSIRKSKTASKNYRRIPSTFFGLVREIPKAVSGDWQRTFRRLDKLAGVHIHAHRWRYTFATDLLSKGVPVSEVAAILGNSPRIVEKHYSQWISSRQAAIDSAVKAVWI